MVDDAVLFVDPGHAGQLPGVSVELRPFALYSVHKGLWYQEAAGEPGPGVAVRADDHGDLQVDVLLWGDLEEASLYADAEIRVGLYMA